MNNPNPNADLRSKGEVHLQVMRISGGATEFAGLVRSMQRPELMQRLEVAVAEFEHWCGCAKEEGEGGNEGENDKDPCPYL